MELSGMGETTGVCREERRRRLAAAVASAQEQEDLKPLLSMARQVPPEWLTDHQWRLVAFEATREEEVGMLARAGERVALSDIQLSELGLDLRWGRDIRATHSLWMDNNSGLLELALGDNSVRVAEFMIAAGSDISRRGEKGKTTLMRAAACASSAEMGSFGAENAMRFLLARSDPKMTDDDGNTVLHWAGCSQSEKIIRMALEAGADTKTRNAAGDTALMAFLRTPLSNPKERVAILNALSAGIDLLAQNAAGESAVDLALKNRDWAVVDSISARMAPRIAAENAQKMIRLLMPTAAPMIAAHHEAEALRDSAEAAKERLSVLGEALPRLRASRL